MLEHVATHVNVPGGASSVTGLACARRPSDDRHPVAGIAGVTGRSLQLDSRSHLARRSLLPGHPAGDGDMGLRSGEVSDEKGEAYETRSQVPLSLERHRSHGYLCAAAE